MKQELFTKEEHVKAVAGKIPLMRRKGKVPFWRQLLEDTAMSLASEALKKIAIEVFREIKHSVSSSYIATRKMTPELYKELYKWADTAGLFGLSSKRHKVLSSSYNYETEDYETNVEVPQGSYRMLLDGCFVTCETGEVKEKSPYGGEVSDKCIIIRVFGPAANKVDPVLSKIVSRALKTGQLRVYDIDNPWRAHSRELRGFDSIVLSPDIREKIVHHLDWWKSSRDMHSQYGLAYKTVMLWHGPPGTGKTTLAQGVAKYLGFDLAIVKIDPNKMVELKDKITGCRKNTVMLIEDVDRAVALPKPKQEPAVAADKPAETASEATKLVELPKQETDRPVPGIEHLMNALDGVMSPEGVVIIMTTNHRDRLDPALIRPGRVNLEILLDLFDWPRAVEMGKLFGFGEDVVSSLGEDVWKVPAELQQRLMQEILRKASQ